MKNIHCSSLQQIQPKLGNLAYWSTLSLTVNSDRLPVEISRVQEDIV